jgi:uncharacterized membrane protein
MNKSTALLAALIVSVGINLLIAGVFLGRMGMPRNEPPPAAWTARDLSPETRGLVRDRMREQLPRVRPLRREMREAQGAVRAAVLAEDFDPAALRAALANLREVGNRYEEFIHENLAEVAASLSPQEREALVQAALERRGGGDRGPRPPPPPR